MTKSRGLSCLHCDFWFASFFRLFCVRLYGFPVVFVVFEKNGGGLISAKLCLCYRCSDAELKRLANVFRVKVECLVYVT